jgi:hypothetical protein
MGLSIFSFISIKRIFHLIFCFILFSSISEGHSSGIHSLCQTVLRMVKYVPYQSETDPLTLSRISSYINSSPQLKNRIVHKNDPEFSIPFFLSRDPRLNRIVLPGKANFPSDLSSLLILGFGVEPLFLQDATVKLTEKALIFDSAEEIQSIWGPIRILVNPQIAQVKITVSSDNEIALQSIAKSIPPTQGLLKRLISLSGKQLIGPSTAYIHRIEIPRDELTAFIIELDQAISASYKVAH